MRIILMVTSAVAVATCLVLSNGARSNAQQTAKSTKDARSMSKEKQQALDLLKSIENGDPKPAGVINPNNYIQHNLAVADGVQGFVELLKQLPAKSARVNTVRVFQDGDYVFAHTEYDFFGPKIGFDIFRFEDGKIVEHWDNLQEKPKTANPSGNTMIDGPVKVKTLDKTADNKKTVRRFVEDVLVNGQLDKLATYFDGDNYVQHNPQIANNLSGLAKALQAMAAQGASMKYERIHKVLGEGNFVLVVSEGSLGDEHTSFYDLFRIENGKIAEHWDTIETIPAKSAWKNDNGKF